MLEQSSRRMVSTNLCIFLALFASLALSPPSAFAGEGSPSPIPIFTGRAVIPPPIRPEVIYEFAEALFRDKDYQTAAAQYQLLLHLAPDFEQANRCKVKIALCKMLLGDLDEAQVLLRDLMVDESMRALWDELTLWQSVCFKNAGDYVSAFERLTALIQDSRSAELRPYSAYLMAWMHLSRAELQLARQTFRSLSESAVNAPAISKIDFKALAGAIDRGAGLKRKSPLTAGILSAVLPGSGHLYCERYRDGCVALALNAAFTGAAIESFHKDVYVAGGIASSVELVFYSGTIYGAVNAAHKFNRTELEEFIGELRREFGDERSLLIENLYR
ncbi:MAG: hypothetical protein JW941_00145 [Candidatus Coatesbacteria bacterium]|nr:hypothetical protein [Candidatus Coatesbacteria bacterium]